MTHSAGLFRTLPWGVVASALLGAAVVVPDGARAESAKPFVFPETITTVGGDSSFRGTIGYDVTLSQPLVLNRLGFWDAFADGLLGSHTVSVFAGGTGALVASAVLPAGSGSLLEDGFRWISIPAIVLSPGRYVIGASMEGDPSLFDEVIIDASSIGTVVGVSFGPNQALISSVVAPGTPIPVNLMPTVVDGGAGYFGPAMAPGPLPLLGASAGWAWSRRLRRRCRQRDGATTRL
jgi:hypothetical protein